MEVTIALWNSIWTSWQRDITTNRRPPFATVEFLSPGTLEMKGTRSLTGY
jgi:hypothetical protein